MNAVLLVVNAGSSSLKFAAFQAQRWPDRNVLVFEGLCEGFGHAPRMLVHDADRRVLWDHQLRSVASQDDALATLIDWMVDQHHRLVAVGHRVVHGGSRYSDPARIDETVIDDLRRLIPLAPLHLPHNLAAIEALARQHPALPQVACFDTAFHATQPAVATRFALPRQLHDEGIRRYGFHGLSYEYIANVLPTAAGDDVAAGRVVVAHLGSGASLCAMRAGRSVATTMGFTALDGLPMGRRCGDVDPGVLLYLMQQKGMRADAIAELLYNESGLLGVSGISDDMRVLAASHQPAAREAIDLFVYRISRELGSMAAALGGLDALVFTAGIGEHQPAIRRRVCLQAAWLGIELDEAINANATGIARISRAGSRVSAWIIPTDEDVMIARHTFTQVGMRGP